MQKSKNSDDFGIGWPLVALNLGIIALCGALLFGFAYLHTVAVACHGG